MQGEIDISYEPRHLNPRLPNVFFVTRLLKGGYHPYLDFHYKGPDSYDF